MSEHKVSVKWARNSTDFGYKNYNRDHVWRFDSGVEVPASAAPAYLGNPQRVDPEAAFVAALSSCHMLTFLALASNKGFVVDSYEDNAVGHVKKTPTASSPSPVSICIQILPMAVPSSRRRRTSTGCMTRPTANALLPIRLRPKSASRRRNNYIKHNFVQRSDRSRKARVFAVAQYDGEEASRRDCRPRKSRTENPSGQASS